MVMVYFICSIREIDSNVFNKIPGKTSRNFSVICLVSGSRATSTGEVGQFEETNMAWQYLCPILFLVCFSKLNVHLVSHTHDDVGMLFNINLLSSYA